VTLQAHSERHDEYAALVRRDLDAVYGYLRALLRDPDLARDLAHDLFLKLRRVVDRLPVGESVPGRGYVLAAARNTAFGHLRRVGTANTGREALARGEGAAPPVATPGEELERSDLRQRLDQALDALDPEHRDVFLLSEVEGLRYAEIAEALGVPEGTVASRKHHAVSKLRRTLERTGHAL
jgi:RNA polymerase sigma-70 factor (ECF subfamily)